MKTRRSCKLKFLVEFESLIKIRISVTGCVATQATKFVANVQSLIYCKLLLVQAKLNEFLFSTQTAFVAFMLIAIIKSLELPEIVAQQALLIPALTMGYCVRKFLEKHIINTPDYMLEILVLVVAQMIIGAPLL